MQLPQLAADVCCPPEGLILCSFSAAGWRLSRCRKAFCAEYGLQVGRLGTELLKQAGSAGKPFSFLALISMAIRGTLLCTARNCCEVPRAYQHNFTARCMDKMSKKTDPSKGQNAVPKSGSAPFGQTGKGAPTTPPVQTKMRN